MRNVDNPSGLITTFTTREVADLLGSSPEQVRRVAKSAFIEPGRGAGGHFLFSFQDLALLRTALELAAARIPPRRIRRALGELRRQVTAGQSLSAIAVAIDGDEVIARDDRAVWSPESGQTHFEFMAPWFESGRPTFDIVPGRAGSAGAEDLSADEWYRIGCEAEETRVDEAQAAFRRALALEPAHRGAHLSLGYLLHQSGHLDEAVLHYRLAAESDPADPDAAGPDPTDGDPVDGLAAFNLGVALEDLGRPEEALHAYRQAIDVDPQLADAHYNLGRLYEERGERSSAFEHLRCYRRLMKS